MRMRVIIMSERQRIFRSGTTVMWLTSCVTRRAPTESVSSISQKPRPARSAYRSRRRDVSNLGPTIAMVVARIANLPRGS